MYRRVPQHVTGHGINVYKGLGGCLSPPWGRQMVKRGEKRQIWAVFHTFQPVDGANIDGFQIFLDFWNRGSYLHTISTIWIFWSIMARFMGI